MSRPATCVAALCVLLAAGCGSTKSHAPKIAPRPGSAAVAAIQERLTKAGYAIVQSGGIPVTGPVSKTRGVLGSFYVEVDFTSPNSFKLDVLVFQSHRDVEGWLRAVHAQRARFLKACRSSPNRFCRFEKRLALPAERAVGPAYYSAATDSPTGKLPLRTFERLVALASGAKRVG